MYIIIGGDGKEYGPITAGDVRQWLAEGRLNEHTLMKADSDAEFRQLGKFPEFADAFAPKEPAPSVPPVFASATATANWAERDYELDLGGCIVRGWDLVKNNFGLLFVTTFLVMLIEGAISGLASIPMVGPVFSILNLIIAGPLMGGLYYVFLQTGRSQTAEVGDVFAGFHKAFAQLFLGHLVPALLAGLCLIPFGIVAAITLVPLIAQGQHGHMDPAALLQSLSGTSVLLIVAALIVCLIPMVYLQTCWAFTIPLIIDKEMDFWTAMGTSRKMVNKHWWHVFGLTILIGLVNLAGMLACCIGVLFTMPIGFAALMLAYETIFSEGSSA